MSDVVMIVGYPAAGKSSIAQSYVNRCVKMGEGYTYLNRDQVGGSVIALLPKMEVAIENGENVVLDNTFPTIASRRPFIESAKARGATITCDWLNTSIEDAQFNACMRMMDRHKKILSAEDMKEEKSPNIFPPVVLFKYKKEFEKPTMTEGFDLVAKREFNRTFPNSWTGKAIFLDYDGTLRDTISGAKWPCHPDDVKILPNRRETLDKYVKLGYLLLGVSNQSGIAKDNPVEKDAIACFEKTNNLLGLNIEYAYCPHRVPPISCFCRKPMPGMAVQFFYKYKLDPTKCIMVGDVTSDKTFAKRSHMKFIHADEFFEAKVTV
jgi:HAD superfamily hydrolase (TIGR01662 family)